MNQLQAGSQLTPTEPAVPVVHYRTEKIDGVNVFYREAGPADAHPERVQAFIVQNGNAYTEGLGAFRYPIKAYRAVDSQADREALGRLVTPELTRFQYTAAMGDVNSGGRNCRRMAAAGHLHAARLPGFGRPALNPSCRTEPCMAMRGIQAVRVVCR